MDALVQQVEVWTAYDAPTHLAHDRRLSLDGQGIRILHRLCKKDGFLHSLDGRCVFVGDSSDVIN